jgi:hypothetical protein
VRGEVERRVEVLIHEQHRGSRLGHAQLALEDLLDEVRGQPERQLVDH